MSKAKNEEKNLSVYEQAREKERSINFARGTRVYLGNRLADYARFWKFLFFVMNMEAVIIVVLSLTNLVDSIVIGNFYLSFNIFSSMFTLYVILLQYYINSLNYYGLSYRAHYHQLELEDWRIALMKIITEKDEKLIETEEFIEKFNEINEKYQVSLKNNDNHTRLDYRRLSYDKKVKDGRVASKKGLRDFSLDMMLIIGNTILVAFVMLLTLYLLIF